MRRLILATFLIAAVWASHFKKHDFNVVIDSVEYKNIPPKWNVDLNVLVPQLKKIAEDVVPRLEGKQPLAGTEAIMNDYADQIFANIQNLVIQVGFDPFQLPDQHSGFNYTLIITYHGELDLTDGWLQDISTIHRGGDVIVSYSSSTKYLEVTVPIAFNDLQFTFDYSAKIMGLGPTGAIQGIVSNVAVEAKIGFDTENLVASLDEFYITNSGHIDLNFSGNPLVDWLINLLTDVVTALLKELILLIVEDVIRGGLDTAIDAINSVIGGILNPATTVAPEATVAAFIYNNY